MRKLLSHRHPSLYWLAVRYHRLKRHLRWLGLRGKMAHRRKERLPCLVKRHSSRLIKHLGQSDLQLQHNKVVNLRLITPLINEVTLAPGETFSFCQLVGKPTRKRGFLEGMELSMGHARSGIGGGICQMANLLHWLVLHSPLTVIERSAHSFDPFPDQNRSIPFGTGCAVFYNYVNLCFRNDTGHTFQFFIWMTETELWGELRSGEEIEETYKIFERHHRYLRQAGTFYRANEIWRKVMTRRGGRHLRDEKIKENFVRVMYEPPEWEEAPSGGIR
ncbi:MAG: VanW family protein [Luteolibacter sp.]